MKQIKRTPVPVPGASSSPGSTATPLKTSVPVPGSAKTTLKSKATPVRTPIPVPGANATPKPKTTLLSTPVPLSGAKATSKATSKVKATPSRTPVPPPGAKPTSNATATPLRTAVPVPGATAARKPKETPQKTPLSQEFIASEDDDDSSNNSDSSPGDAPQPKTVEKAAVMIGVNKPSGVVKLTPKSNTKAKLARKTASTPQTLARERSLSPVPVPRSIFDGNPRADVSAGAGDSSDSSDSSGDESTAQQTPQQVLQPAQQQPQTPAHAVTFVPTLPYTPPKGFVPVPINDTTTSNIGSIFDNLGERQIWHITAPAGVSLKNLQELMMEELLDGKTIFHVDAVEKADKDDDQDGDGDGDENGNENGHEKGNKDGHEDGQKKGTEDDKEKGEDYRLSMMDLSEDNVLEVMIPQQDGYQAVSARISRTLHVQPAAQMPTLGSAEADQNTRPEAANSITRSTIRAPRPQVKRLKMRFLPAGFMGDDVGTLGDSESEAELPSTTAVLDTPNDLRLPVRIEKRKRGHVNGVKPVDLAPKTSKKHRTPEEIKRREERRAKKEKRRAKEAARSQS